MRGVGVFWPDMEIAGPCTGEFAAHVAQLVEHILGKDEVSGSIPLVGSITKK